MLKDSVKLLTKQIPSPVDGVYVTGIPEESIHAIYKIKKSRKKNFIRYVDRTFKHFATNEDRQKVVDSLTFSIYRNSTDQVWFVTYTLKGKIDINGENFYPSTASTDNYIKRLHSNLQKRGVDSWWFKEFTKAGTQHYHGIVNHWDIPQESQKAYLASFWHYGDPKQQRILLANDKLASIKYTTKGGDFVASSTLLNQYDLN